MSQFPWGGGEAQLGLAVGALLRVFHGCNQGAGWAVLLWAALAKVIG